MSEITGRVKAAIADRYTIERELGQGGMATVYLAHDVKHDRKVALKVLRPELAAVIGAERFLQEIKVTANLQHPHILPLHDSGEIDSFLYYVMPYVEGESLRDKLRREKQLAVAEAIELTRNVAAALDYAHRHDVIHRDIKPENILLHDGQALIADFGIALAVSEAGGNRLTETGLSIGTPHYMSPEQAMGDRELDARSDIYSLGAMLYEMLTGDPPYTGSTAQAIVAKVITEKAPLVTMVRDTVPRHVALAIHKALAKLPADRYPTAAALAEALVRPGLTATDTHAVLSSAERRAAAVPSVARDRRLVSLAAVLVVAVAAALWGWLRPQRAPDLSRFATVLPAEQALSANHDGNTIALSPDGRRLVYTGPDRALYVRELGQLEARPLPGTEGARAPFFSPNGEWVAFFADAALKKVALGGGPPLTITTGIADFRGGSWGDDDMIVFAGNTTDPLHRVSAAGGTVEPVTTLDSASGESSHRWPEILPGARSVVFTSFGGNITDATLAAASLETGEVTRFPLHGLRPQYANTGHLVYGTADGSLVAVPFDARRLEVTGAPVSLLEGVMVRVSVLAEYALSRTGNLVYLSGSAPDLSLVLVTRDGAEEVLIEELGEPESPRFSPDGQRIALTLIEAGNTDVWVYDLAQGTLTRMTFEGNNRYPVWSADGRRIAFSHSAEGSGDRSFYILAADGSGTMEPLHAAEGQQWELAWLPNGRDFVKRQSVPGTGRDIWLVRADSVAARSLIETEFNERSLAVSPDGRWLAYASNESGRDEVYLRPVPGPGGKRQVSVDGGTEPLWARSGRELFYRGRDGQLYTVAISTSPTLSVGRRAPLFEDRYVANPSHTNFDVHPDDGRFVMLKGTQETTELVVVLNWFEELKERVGR